MRGTSHVGLVYDKNFDISREIVGYVDFDYVRDLDRRRSLTRYVFTLCGNVISWKATLQSTIALSTIEAKCMTATEAVKEVIWLKGLVSQFRLITGVDCVYCDSQSVIHLTKNQMFHEGTKYINVKIHFFFFFFSFK